MPEQIHRDQLQPSLLDRLTDDEPDRKVESRDRQTLSARKLKEAVLRDLHWLFNTHHLGAEHLGHHEHVASSVLNYGIPDLTGVTASNIDGRQVERYVRQIIWDFEPRLLKRSVKVHLRPAGEKDPLNHMWFQIEADLWARHEPVHLLLLAHVDLESGTVTLSEDRGQDAV